MDSDSRAADRLSAEDRAGSHPSKLARTDTFPVRMQFQNHEIRGSLVRSNSSIIPDCRLGCSSTSTAASSAMDSHTLFIGGDANYVSDARLLRNESLISASRALALHHHHHQQQQQQALPFKSSALLSAYGEMERGGEGMLPHTLQPSVALFTPSQLRELQLHALIFKHMVCGVNVPPELVLLVRTSVAALAGMTPGAAHLGSLGWGNYHLGYGNSVDPEPGRCRRTDGKKWRCARDVVPEQKYCERHMHRGRHRARKPPEPLSSTAASASPSPSSSTVTTGLPRSAVGTPSSSPTASFLSGPKSSSIISSLHLQQQQLALQAARSLNSEEHVLFSDAHALSQGPSPAVSGLSSVLSSAVSSPVGSMQSRHAQPHSFLGAAVYESAAGMSREPEGQPLRHFFDDWPRGRDPSSLTWPDMEGEQHQRSSSNGARNSSTTQLSISIPSMQAEFASNAGSPRGGKLALSPLKLSMSRGDEDPLGVEAATQMGLGVGLGVNETERQRQSSSWVPIAWETASVGGPLAEVLQSSSNTPRGGGSHAASGIRTGSGLNLMPDAWESSPRSSPPTSSPTGVLQMNATFSCFSSDNSTASSPRSAALKQPPEPTV